MKTPQQRGQERTYHRHGTWDMIDVPISYTPNTGLLHPIRDPNGARQSPLSSISTRPVAVTRAIFQPKLLHRHPSIVEACNRFESGMAAKAAKPTLVLKRGPDGSVQWTRRTVSSTHSSTSTTGSTPSPALVDNVFGLAGPKGDDDGTELNRVAAPSVQSLQTPSNAHQGADKDVRSAITHDADLQRLSPSASPSKNMISAPPAPELPQPSTALADVQQAEPSHLGEPLSMSKPFTMQAGMDSKNVISAPELPQLSTAQTDAQQAEPSDFEPPLSISDPFPSPAEMESKDEISPPSAHELPQLSTPRVDAQQAEANDVEATPSISELFRMQAEMESSDSSSSDDDESDREQVPSLRSGQLQAPGRLQSVLARFEAIPPFSSTMPMHRPIATVAAPADTVPHDSDDIVNAAMKSPSFEIVFSDDTDELTFNGDTTAPADHKSVQFGSSTDTDELTFNGDRTAPADHKSVQFGSSTGFTHVDDIDPVGTHLDVSSAAIVDNVFGFVRPKDDDDGSDLNHVAAPPVQGLQKPSDDHEAIYDSVRSGMTPDVDVQHLSPSLSPSSQNVISAPPVPQFLQRSTPRVDSQQAEQDHVKASPSISKLFQIQAEMESSDSSSSDDDESDQAQVPSLRSGQLQAPARFKSVLDQFEELPPFPSAMLLHRPMTNVPDPVGSVAPDSDDILNAALKSSSFEMDFSDDGDDITFNGDRGASAVNKSMRFASMAGFSDVDDADPVETRLDMFEFPLIKHGRRGRPRRVFVTVDVGAGVIRWGNGRRWLKIEEILQVRSGKQTSVFRKRVCQDVDARLCLSLIVKERSLDLECKTEEERKAVQITIMNQIVGYLRHNSVRAAWIRPRSL